MASPNSHPPDSILTDNPEDIVIDSPYDEVLQEVLQRYRNTPDKTIKELYVACVINDTPTFKAKFDEWALNGWEIGELGDVRRAAIARNNVEIVSIFISHGQTPHTSSALDALENDAKGVLELFLEQGWDINQPLAQGQPPLLGFAVQDEEMTLWLLDHGADPNRDSLIDMTPTTRAVLRAPLTTIKLLFDRGADITKGQLFHHGVFREGDEIPVLEFLLEKGANVNAKMYEDHSLSFSLYCFMGLGTALHQAALLGKMDVARWLLEKGADPMIKDALYRTALDWAVKDGHPEVAKALEEAMEQYQKAV